MNSIIFVRILQIADDVKTRASAIDLAVIRQSQDPPSGSLSVCIFLQNMIGRGQKLLTVTVCHDGL